MSSFKASALSCARSSITPLLHLCTGCQHHSKRTPSTTALDTLPCILDGLTSWIIKSLRGALERAAGGYLKQHVGIDMLREIALHLYSLGTHPGAVVRPNRYMYMGYKPSMSTAPPYKAKTKNMNRYIQQHSFYIRVKGCSNKCQVNCSTACYSSV